MLETPPVKIRLGPRQKCLVLSDPLSSGRNWSRGPNTHPQSRNTKKKRVYTNVFEKFVQTFACYPVTRVRNPTEIVQKNLFRWTFIYGGFFRVDFPPLIKGSFIKGNFDQRVHIGLPVPLPVPTPPPHPPDTLPLFPSFLQEDTHLNPTPKPSTRDTNKNSHPFATTGKNYPLVSARRKKHRNPQIAQVRVRHGTSPYVS